MRSTVGAGEDAAVERAGHLEYPCAAVFSPSGAIVRLRRGTKQLEALAALMAASPRFTVCDACQPEIELLEAIRRGKVEVM
jgi:hypothetical protein